LICLFSILTDFIVEILEYYMSGKVVKKEIHSNIFLSFWKENKTCQSTSTLY